MVVMTSLAPERAFITPGMAPQIPPEMMPTKQHQRYVNVRRKTKAGRADQPAEEATDHHLAFDTDVEHARSRCDCKRQSAEDQWCRGDQCLGNRATTTERTLKERRVRLDRVLV